MTENERVKVIRKAKSLTLEEFGKRICLGNTAVSKIERGENSLTPMARKIICQEFGVSETWLRTGEGEMWAVQPDPPSDDLGKVLDAYKLPKELRPLFEGYLGLSDQARKEVQGLLVKWARDVAAQHADKEENLIEPQQEMTREELQAEFNHQLDLEEEAKAKFSVSGDGSSGTATA